MVLRKTKHLKLSLTSIHLFSFRLVTHQTALASDEYKSQTIFTNYY